MQPVNGVYATRANRRRGRRGYLFRARFGSWIVDTEEHAEAACRYVLLNPVRAGLCDGAEAGRGAAAATEKLSKANTCSRPHARLD